MLTPLQIVVYRDRTNHRTDEYVNALRLAFEGSTTNTLSKDVHYITDSSELKINVLDPRGFTDSKFDVTPILRAAKITIFVRVKTDQDGPLPKCVKKLKSKLRKKYCLAVDVPSLPEDPELQSKLTGSTLIEPRLRPIATALMALETARQALVRELKSGDRGHKKNHRTLKFFLSHAKLDGVPVALALVELMQRLNKSKIAKSKGFNKFYDAIDIPLGTKWQSVIKENAENSVLIVLRTKEYENRMWCRAEYLMAEKRCLPILIVDLRNGLYEASSQLPFDSAPTVRLHDGNLIRVIFHAIAIHIRKLCTDLQINDKRCQFLPRRPSILMLQGAINTLKEEEICLNKFTFLYASPKLSDPYKEAYQRFLCEDDRQLS